MYIYIYVQEISWLNKWPSFIFDLQQPVRVHTLKTDEGKRKLVLLPHSILTTRNLSHYFCNTITALKKIIYIQFIDIDIIKLY